MSDAAARNEALDPTRSFIVQAPAGSGKTELLTQRFLRLLAAVEHPEQILAITFTRKAAAEMRSRILRAIEGAEGAPPDSPHKRSTWELARAVRELDARLGWKLVVHPARLRIQTIDALNAMLARRLPIISAVGAPLEPTEDARPLYEAACRALIERLGEEHRELQGLEALIAHLGNRTESLIELLSDLLERRDQWLHQVMSARTLEYLRGYLEAALQGVIEHQLARLYALLSAAQRAELGELAQFAARNLLGTDALRQAQLEACARFSGTLEAQSRCLPLWRMVADILLTRDGEVLRQFTKRHGFPTTAPLMKARLQRMLDEVRQDERLVAELRALRQLPDPHYSSDQWRIVEALLEVLPLAVGELQLVFQQEGKGDYVETALRALDALGEPQEPTDAALAFDYRLRHVLVDEFQDTSYTQLDLLERLTAGWAPGDGRTLFCVGDPMQSIYRFRQADVGLFLQLQGRGLRNVALTPLTLSMNFRSTRPVVEWVNRVFPTVLPPTNDAEQGAVQYSASAAAVESGEGGVHVHPFIGEDEAAESRAVIEVIQRTLAHSADAKIAVLVSARTHVARLSRELANAGIEYEAVEIELLRERPVVQDLIALTRALLHLADRTAWLAVLRAPWCGLSLEALHALAAADRSQTIHALLERALRPGAGNLATENRPLRPSKRRAPSSAQLALDLPELVNADPELSSEGKRRAERVFFVLEAALAERGRWTLREWVERTWNALHGPATLLRAQDLSDAEAFFRRLEQIERAGDLEDVASLERRLDRLFAQPRGDAAARVEVMTIHKAKGLEFDTVILPALQRGTRGEERELLRWARIAGPSGGIVLAPVKADGAAADPIYAWIERLEKERARHERARLLYVAATRARRELHLFGAVELDAKDGRSELCEPRAGTMLGMLWTELRPAFEAALAQDARRGAPAAEPKPPQTIRRLPLDWAVPTADAAAARGKTANLIDLVRPEFDWASEVSRHVGTLVHRELERMNKQARGPHVRDAARGRLMLELAELGVPPDRCEDACERVLLAIERTLDDPRGQWLLGLASPVRESESELALSGVVNDEVINGVIDRTFIDEAGVRWIVDFKTSTHEGGGLEAFLEQEVERYRPQLARYAQLLRLYRPAERVQAALYFPLLRQWREVRV